MGTQLFTHTIMKLLIIHYMSFVTLLKNTQDAEDRSHCKLGSRTIHTMYTDFQKKREWFEN
jgi:hypothetical protein